jgi:hypothetical protein
LHLVVRLFRLVPEETRVVLLKEQLIELLGRAKFDAEESLRVVDAMYPRAEADLVRRLTGRDTAVRQQASQDRRALSPGGKK